MRNTVAAGSCLKGFKIKRYYHQKYYKLFLATIVLVFIPACITDNQRVEYNESRVDLCKKNPDSQSCGTPAIANNFISSKASQTQNNYIFRAIKVSDKHHHNSHGATESISNSIYGTVAGIESKTVFSKNDFSDNSFKEASKAQLSDITKINVLKITSRIKGKSKTPSENYYYNHIDKKKFTRFLPAINKLEILALDSKLDMNIFHSYMPDGQKEPKNYAGLKELVDQAKGMTFKGFALVGFANNLIQRTGENQRDIHPREIVDNKLYPGKFSLTFNKSGIQDVFNLGTSNYFSMTVTLDQATLKLMTPSEGKASKPRLDTIKIENFYFYDEQNQDAESYVAKKSSKKYKWDIGSYHAKFGNFLAFSKDKAGNIDQIAGTLNLQKTIATSPNQNGTNKLQRWLQIVYASNEIVSPSQY